MNYVEKLIDGVNYIFDLNQATLSGAIDIIVVRQPDGSLRSTPFHVRFGKLQLLRTREKVVDIMLNDKPSSLKMKLGHAGEAFFVERTLEPVPAFMATSPIRTPSSHTPPRQSASGLASPLSLDDVQAADLRDTTPMELCAPSESGEERELALVQAQLAESQELTAESCAELPSTAGDEEKSRSDDGDRASPSDPKSDCHASAAKSEADGGENATAGARLISWESSSAQVSSTLRRPRHRRRVSTGSSADPSEVQLDAYPAAKGVIAPTSETVVVGADENEDWSWKWGWGDLPVITRKRATANPLVQSDKPSRRQLSRNQSLEFVRERLEQSAPTVENDPRMEAHWTRSQSALRSGRSYTTSAVTTATTTSALAPTATTATSSTITAATTTTSSLSRTGNAGVAPRASSMLATSTSAHSLLITATSNTSALAARSRKETEKQTTEQKSASAQSVDGGSGALTTGSSARTPSERASSPSLERDPQTHAIASSQPTTLQDQSNAIASTNVSTASTTTEPSRTVTPPVLQVVGYTSPEVLREEPRSGAVSAPSPTDPVSHHTPPKAISVLGIPAGNASTGAAAAQLSPAQPSPATSWKAKVGSFLSIFARSSGTKPHYLVQPMDDDYNIEWDSDETSSDASDAEETDAIQMDLIKPVELSPASTDLFAFDDEQERFSTPQPQPVTEPPATRLRRSSSASALPSLLEAERHDRAADPRSLLEPLSTSDAYLGDPEPEKHSSHSPLACTENKVEKVSSGIQLGFPEAIPTSPDEPPLALSLCADKLLDPSFVGNDEEAAAIFDAHRVDYDHFVRTEGLLQNPNLVLRYQDMYCPWSVAAPTIVCRLAFQRPLDGCLFEALRQKEEEKRSSRGWRSWFSWGGSRQRSTAPAAQSDSAVNATISTQFARMPRSISEEHGTLARSPTSPSHPFAMDSDAEEDLDGFDTLSDGPETLVPRLRTHPLQMRTQSMPVLPSVSPSPSSPSKSLLAKQCEQRFYVRKSLRPSSDSLQKLDLHDGQNTISFSVTSELRGTQVVRANIWLWNYDDKIVISDIDGTITRSDVMGQIAPFVGRDWSHSGVARLYSDIQRNGYRIMYLSSRAIGQATKTKQFLDSVKQDDVSLPQGPLILSPDRLLLSFNREVVQRRPEEFKTACLKDVASLFPNLGSRAFFAGFGNRISDVIAYREVGIPESKVFIINPKGEVTTPHSRSYKKSYSTINELVHEMFPFAAKGKAKVDEVWNQFNYWKPPCSLLSDEEEWG